MVGLQRHTLLAHHVRRAVFLLATALAACSSARTPVETPDRVTYEPGRSYFGRNGYIEYRAGSLPVILTAPHGGDLRPAEITDRTAALCGGSATTVTDSNTRELVLAMRDSMFARYGRYPHVIISHLGRSKLDPNRPAGEGACGDAEAGMAWTEFQTFVDSAEHTVLRQSGRGWYMDVHGHGHAVQRLELGYLLSGADLDGTDERLNTIAALEDSSSIRTMSRSSALTFAQLLRGPTSLGALYVTHGFPAVPTEGAPGPAGAPYFSGGYNTERHGCSVAARGADTAICGLQIETNFTGVRDNANSRARFAGVTAQVLGAYLKLHWGLDLATN
ncbi:MAG: hypothetical protein ABIV28_03350 [Longimicrobiales bacterium]